MHECPVGGCPKQVASHLLMCRPHWRKVPRDIQQRVYTGWREGIESDLYVEARGEAIASVELEKAS